MSMDRCITCFRPVDTDEDTDCYDAEGQCTCEPCRDATVDYWRAIYDATPPAERNPTQYRQDMIEAGRGHLLPPE